MAIKKSWSEWWRRFLGLYAGGQRKAVEILRERYVEESQHVARFTRHAHKMQYPQFRDKLLQIADEEAKHAEWIADKIRLLGGKLPEVREISPAEKNNWQCLMADLEEEQRCSGDLEDEIVEIQSELPGVAEVLEHIREDGQRHRKEIREMLIRSDPQALWPA